MPSIEQFRAQAKKTKSNKIKSSKSKVSSPSKGETNRGSSLTPHQKFEGTATTMKVQKRRPAKEQRMAQLEINLREKLQGQIKAEPLDFVDQASKAKRKKIIKGENKQLFFNELNINVIEVEEENVGKTAVNSPKSKKNKTQAGKVRDAVSENETEHETEHEINTKASNAETISESEELKKDLYQFSFPGNELVRTRFPKSTALAEAIVDDWIRGGEFDELPLEHPVASAVAQRTLKKAKEIEQKALNHPVLEKAALHALTIGFRVHSKMNEIKSKFRK